MNIQYSHLIPYISNARANSIKSSLNNSSVTDRQIIGVYLWQQQVISMLQPVIQILEVTLRNSLHKECMRRFSNVAYDQWWADLDFVYTNKGLPDDKFLSSIKSAEKTFRRNYFKKNQSRYTGTVHADDVVANATLSCWVNLFTSDFVSPTRSENQKYLWPVSFTKAFRGLSRQDIAKPSSVLVNDLANLIKSFRDLRNRVSHHDCLWSKSSLSGGRNLEQAGRQISISIEHKIDKLEELMQKISPLVNSLVSNWGIFIQLRKVVSYKHLLRFLDEKYYKFSSEEEKDMFFSIYISHLNSAYRIARNSSKTICR